MKSLNSFKLQFSKLSFGNKFFKQLIYAVVIIIFLFALIWVVLKIQDIFSFQPTPSLTTEGLSKRKIDKIKEVGGFKEFASPLDINAKKFGKADPFSPPGP